MLRLPVGAGKTICATHLIRAARERGKRALFLVDSIELLDQTSMRFDEEGIDHGVIQSNHWRTRGYEPVQIASIATLVRRETPQFDLCIADEVHLGGDRLKKFVLEQRVPVIGLTATPYSRGMGTTWQSMVSVATITQLMNDGFLVPTTVYAPSEPDLEGVKVVAGEWKDDELSERCNTPDLVGDIVQTWLTKADDRQTIAFAVDIAHAKFLASQFAEAGVPAASIDGYQTREVRKPIVDSYRRGDLRVLVNVGVVSRGFDVPETSCIILARPIRSSLSLYIQQIGRGLRPGGGHDDCLVLDHAGNTVRHGFVTDPQPDKLDDGKKAAKKPIRKVAEPKKCPKCFFVRPPHVHTCPKCGFAPARVNEIFHEAGTLEQITKTEDKQVLYAEILWIARQRGYNPGWVAHSFRKFNGVWPRGMADVQPRPPTEWTQRRIKAMQIRWAKGKEARAGA